MKSVDFAINNTDIASYLQRMDGAVFLDIENIDHDLQENDNEQNQAERNHTFEVALIGYNHDFFQNAKLEHDSIEYHGQEGCPQLFIDKINYGINHSKMQPYLYMNVSKSVLFAKDRLFEKYLDRFIESVYLEEPEIDIREMKKKKTLRRSTYRPSLLNNDIVPKVVQSYRHDLGPYFAALNIQYYFERTNFIKEFITDAKLMGSVITKKEAEGAELVFKAQLKEETTSEDLTELESEAFAPKSTYEDKFKLK